MLASPKINYYAANESLKVSRENKLNNELKKANNVKTSSKLKFYLCIFALTAFVLGIALVVLAANVSAKGLELNGIKREYNNIQVHNQRLELERARLLAHGNIEMIAITELGMVRPQLGNFRMVTPEEAAIKEALLALNNPSENRAISMTGNEYSPSLMNRIVNIFSGWGISGLH